MIGSALLPWLAAIGLLAGDAAPSDPIADPEDPTASAVAELALRSLHPVRYLRDDRGMAWIELGAGDAPRVLVMPCDLITDGSAGGAWERTTDGSVLLSVRRLATSKDASALLRDVTLVVPVAAPRAGEDGDGQVEWERNFPARWDEARRAVGAAAGPYPTSEPGVRSLVAWTTEQSRLAAVVLIGPRPAAGGHPPGSFAAFCVEQLGVSLAYLPPATGQQARGGVPPGGEAAPFGETLEAALLRAIDGLPRLGWGAPRWRRLGTDTWLLDIDLSNDGGTATGRTLHEQLRRARGVRAGLRIRGAGWEWSACALQDPASRHFELVPQRSAAPRVEGVAGDATLESGAAVELADLAPASHHRLRLIVTRSDSTTGSPSGRRGDGERPPGSSIHSAERTGEPILDLWAEGARSRGATSRALSPATPRTAR